MTCVGGRELWSRGVFLMEVSHEGCYHKDYHEEFCLGFMQNDLNNNVGQLIIKFADEIKFGGIEHSKDCQRGTKSVGMLRGVVTNLIQISVR